MSIGVYDEGETFFGDLVQVFSNYKELHVGVLRVNLYWGGPLGVAKNASLQGERPARRRLRLDALRPHGVLRRRKYGIKVLFSITGTPRWANGGQSPNRPPLRLLATCASSPMRPRPATAAHMSATTAAPCPPCGSGPRGTSRTIRPSCGRSSSSRAAKWVIAERGRLRQDLQRRLRGRPRDAVQERAGRVRRHRAAREQQPGERRAVRLTGRVPDGGEEGRDEDLRRLRAQPVLRRADRDADDAAAGHAVRRAADRDHARQHQRADRRRLATSTGRGRSGSPSTATRPIRPTRSSACRGRSRRAT